MVSIFASRQKGPGLNLTVSFLSVVFYVLKLTALTCLKFSKTSTLSFRVQVKSLCCPAMDWQSVQGAPRFCPSVTGTCSSIPWTAKHVLKTGWWTIILVATWTEVTNWLSAKEKKKKRKSWTYTKTKILKSIGPQSWTMDQYQFVGHKKIYLYGNSHYFCSDCERIFILGHYRIRSVFDLLLTHAKTFTLVTYPK